MEKILKDLLKSPQLLQGQAWKRKQYKANDIIVKEGEIGSSLFFIESGVLRVTKRIGLEKDKYVQPGVGELKAGTIFGESSLHCASPRITTVSAITEVDLLEIDGKCLVVYLDDNPVKGYLFYKKLFDIVRGRLKNVNHTVETLMAWGIKAHEIDRYL